MTSFPDDQVDPYERQLTRRVGDFAEQAVRPIDAVSIAAAAHAGARRQNLAGRLFGSSASMARLGLVLAGGLVGAAALAVYLGAGGGPLGQNQSSNDPVATPTNVPGAAASACLAANLTAGISAWEGAAGHRIATVRVQNAGATDCLLPQFLRPALVDLDGHALIVGEFVPQPAPIALPAGAVAQTLVDMANYCGAAPTGQLLLRFYLDDDTSFEAADKMRPRAGLDPPPCSGPNQPGQIDVQGFTLAAGGY